MDTKEAAYIVGRYLALVLLAISNLFLFYLIFTPLTVYPVFWMLQAADAGAKILEGNVLFFKGIYVELIQACIAASAYYLLAILNLATPMSLKKRVMSMAFLLVTFLYLNVLRILLFSSLAARGFQYFDIAHQLTWYLGSTILVVGLWFINIWLFKIESVPIYTDMLSLYWEAVQKKAFKSRSKSSAK